MLRSTGTVGVKLCGTLQRCFFTYPKGELDSYKGIKLSTGNEIEGLEIVDDRGLIVGCYSTNVNVFLDLFARVRMDIVIVSIWFIDLFGLRGEDY